MRQSVSPYVLPGLRMRNLSKRQKDLIGKSMPNSNALIIKKMVCDYFKISEDDLTSKCRKTEIIWPRQVFCYLCTRYTHLSLDTIGQNAGYHEHTSVIHCRGVVMDMMSTNELKRKDIEVLGNKLITHATTPIPIA